MNTLARSIFLLSWASLSLACAGAVQSGTTDGGTDGGVDAAADSPGTGGVGPVTEVGKAIWTPSVQQVVVWNHGGGFSPGPPAGSTCTTDATKYTLVVATRAVSWSKCGPAVPADPWKETTGNRTLTGPAYTQIEALLGQVKVVKSDGCGADKSLLTLSVSTAKGDLEYVDVFYACNYPGRVFVDGIDAVLGKLAELTR